MLKVGGVKAVVDRAVTGYFEGFGNQSSKAAAFWAVTGSKAALFSAAS